MIITSMNFAIILSNDDIVNFSRVRIALYFPGDVKKHAEYVNFACFKYYIKFMIIQTDLYIADNTFPAD